MDQLGSNIWLVVTLLNGAGPDPTLVSVGIITPGRTQSLGDGILGE